MSEIDIAAHSPGRAAAGYINNADIDLLAAVQRQFLHNLSFLDQIGEHVAAAYLAAAVDLLDERLALAGRTVGDRRGGILDEFAQRLAERLGPRAVDVARTQLSHAEGNTLVVWTTIVNQLERDAD